jgi:hypothetical protein
MFDSSTPNAEALVDSTNPYQPPRSESPGDFEQKFARRLLSLRHKQLTLRRLYRMQLKVIAILLVTFGAAVSYFAWLNLLPGVYAMLGMFAGVLLRDFGIARAQKRVWPIQTKLMDWEKVERMAARE